MEDLDRIVAVTQASGYLDRTVFISLDWITLERIARQVPEHPIGFIVDDAEEMDEAVRRSVEHGHAFIDAHAELLLEMPDLAGPVVGHGLDVGVWTVNDAAAAERLIGMGVTRFTTNTVELLLDWRSDR